MPEVKGVDTALAYAEKITLQLFEAVEKNNLIVPGKSEAQLSKEVEELALDVFGLDKHWHKKIVRTGINTLAVYTDNPPDRIIQEDDILFIDFGPIVDGYEADIGRTYLMGNDPMKMKIKRDVEKAWYETREWVEGKSELRACDIFQYVVEKAEEYGWSFGGVIAGHIVGEYPHEQPADPKSWELDIHPENPNDIFLLDANGNRRTWVLELQFIDKKNKFGGYFEQILL